MKLYPLFATEKRQRLLGHLLEHPSQEVNMNRLARELGLSVGQVHKYIGILRREGLFSGTRLRETPAVRALRLIWNLKRLNEKGAAKALLLHLPKATGIGLYGSWARGANTEGANLNLWVKMPAEPEDIELARARKELRRRLDVPVDIAPATPERLELLMAKNSEFHSSLRSGITLWGEEL